ncbi:hypothetical protein J4E90_000014 [Alternaria incomplexa]|uniref:uncharacterized protein n=1 Tax=Alternaria incomplexa TaxID=1187928 RepID=UPI00222009FF|nr:uncharacterized protein J4E90_000014 [Alternaria incomplexa]KAI4921588.1 hypothetical protein J4E90_000014 [Alternaria incomplexa]
MRFQLAHIFCLLGAAESLAIGAPEKDYALLDSRDIAAPLDRRTDIEVAAGFVSNGGTATLAIVSIANYLAVYIKGQSDVNSCSVISGNVDGAVWQYYATTSGPKCDTTSETKTIRNAVERELKWMQANGYDAACFKMDHGGTWEGHLKIALNGKPIASDTQCNAAKFVNL